MVVRAWATMGVPPFHITEKQKRLESAWETPSSRFGS